SHGHRMDKLRRTRSYQPVLTDIRSIAPTGWFGAPQHANAEKGHRMDKLRRTRSYQPVLTDIRSIAPTGWFGSPQQATPEKGRRMVTDIAAAIANEASAIFRQLAAVQAGPAEIKRVRQVR
ncbi:MAG: hypothetical protein ACJ8E5_14255, partial [Xanthobacteraceae bacterium]